MKKKPTTLGVPYARQKVLNGKVYCICRSCGQDIELSKRKDSDSFSTEEYARHYDECSAARARRIADRIFAKRFARQQQATQGENDERQD